MLSNIPLLQVIDFSEAKKQISKETCQMKSQLLL